MQLLKRSFHHIRALRSKVNQKEDFMISETRKRKLRSLVNDFLKKQLGSRKIQLSEIEVRWLKSQYPEINIELGNPCTITRK